MRVGQNKHRQVRKWSICMPWDWISPGGKLHPSLEMYPTLSVCCSGNGPTSYVIIPISKRLLMQKGDKHMTNFICSKSALTKHSSNHAVPSWMTKNISWARVPKCLVCLPVTVRNNLTKINKLEKNKVNKLSWDDVLNYLFILYCYIMGCESVVFLIYDLPVHISSVCLSWVSYCCHPH